MQEREKDRKETSRETKEYRSPLFTDAHFNVFHFLPTTPIIMSLFFFVCCQYNRSTVRDGPLFASFSAFSSSSCHSYFVTFSFLSELSHEFVLECLLSNQLTWRLPDASDQSRHGELIVYIVLSLSSFSFLPHRKPSNHSTVKTWIHGAYLKRHRLYGERSCIGLCRQRLRIP